MALGTVVQVYLISGNYEFIVVTDVSRTRALDLAGAYKYSYTYYLFNGYWAVFDKKIPYPDDPWVQPPDDNLLKLIKMHVLLES